MRPFSTTLLEVAGDKPHAFQPVSFDGHVSEARLEDWIVDNPELVGEPLLVLGRQLAEFAEDQDRLDILAVDETGEIVLIELKVADNFRVTDLQALAYAGAYASRDTQDLAQTLRRHLEKSTPVEAATAAGVAQANDVGDPNLPGADAAASATEMTKPAQSISAESEVRLDDAKERIVEFLEVDDFDVWQPSQHVRIKLVAPAFPRRVLKTVKWLGDVYNMPVEAIAVRLFDQGDGRYGLTFERLLPLPDEDEFDMTVRRREERKRSENVTRRPAIVPALMNADLLKDGQTLWLNKTVLFVKDRELYDPDSLVFQVKVRIEDDGSAKFAWRSSEEQEPELLPPSAVPFRAIKALIPDWQGEERYSPVGRSFIIERDGQTLEQFAVENGVWSPYGET